MGALQWPRPGSRDGGSRRSSHDEQRAQRHCEQWWWVAQHAGGRIRTGDPPDKPPAPATAPKTGRARPPQPPQRPVDLIKSSYHFLSPSAVHRRRSLSAFAVHHATCRQCVNGELQRRRLWQEQSWRRRWEQRRQQVVVSDGANVVSAVSHQPRGKRGVSSSRALAHVPEHPPPHSAAGRPPAPAAACSGYCRNGGMPGGCSAPANSLKNL